MKKSITFRIDEKLYDKLIKTNVDMNKQVKKFVIKPHITKSAIIKVALEKFLNEYWNEQIN